MNLLIKIMVSLININGKKLYEKILSNLKGNRVQNKFELFKTGIYLLIINSKSQFYSKNIY